MRYAFVLFCLLVSSGAACANTFVFINQNPNAPSQAEHFVYSAPAANQTVAQPPANVMITFSNPIRPDKSSMGVYDLYGTRIDDGTVTVNGPTMLVNLPPLASGRYAVKWKTRCMCDDDTDLGDEFHFTVR
jgi:methionine-rich copper-binding protein CopC